MNPRNFYNKKKPDDFFHQAIRKYLITILLDCNFLYGFFQFFLFWK